MLSTSYKLCTRIFNAIGHANKQVKGRLKQGLKLGFFTIALSTLVACGGGDEKSHTPRVGVSIASYNDTFLISLKDDIEKYAKEAYGGKVDLIFVDAKSDAVTQLGQVENFIVQKVDGIIVIPVDTEATQPMTDSIQKAGIELVYLNRRPTYLPDGVFYVGSDSLKFGQEQAKYVVEHRDGGNISILIGVLTHEAAILRTQGVEEFFADKPSFKITRKQTGLWQRALGMSVTENWLNSGDIPDIIISNNDEMALGAIQALRAIDKLEDTLVVGVDATPDGLMAIKAGDLDATVFQDGRGQARGGVDTIMAALNGTKQDQVVWVPAELVTQDNLAAFEAKHGK